MAGAPRTLAEIRRLIREADRDIMERTRPSGRMKWRSLPPLEPSCCRMGGGSIGPDHDATPRVPRPRCSLKPDDWTIGVFDE